MEERKLCIPIYLNQKIVFDLLSIVEGGFSQFKKIKTSEADSEIHKTDGVADIGVSNVFAFLSVNLRGGKSKETSSGKQTEVEEERVFTPTSLFSKLRDVLLERKLIIDLQNNQIKDLLPGSFIEFNGVLRKNPLIESMESFIQLMETIVLLTGENISVPNQASPKNANDHKNKPKKVEDPLIQTMKRFLGMLTENKNIDLVANIKGVFNGEAVIPVELNYFADHSLGGIIDGQFTVLGKIVRYIKNDSDEKINLLRETPLAKIPDENLNQFLDGFNKLQQQGFKMSKLITGIEGPAIQVVPIAIYL
jgi:hypothetical protein